MQSHKITLNTLNNLVILVFLRPLMKKLFIYISVLFIAFSCEPKFDPSDDFKEVDIVYAVLDPDADKQYIQVSRGFQAGGENALDVAQNTDSTYHSDSLVVEIIEYIDGQETQRAQLKKETFNSREDGVFSNPEHNLYTIEKSQFKLDTNTKYKVRVQNSKTGKTSNASVKTLSAFQFTETVSGNKAFYPNLIKENKIQDGEIVIVNNFKKDVLFEITVHIPYYTRDKFNNIIDSATITYKSTKSQFGDASSPTTKINFNGNLFFNSIFENVPNLPNPQYTRIFGVILVDVKCFGNEMYQYVEAENNFNALSQTKPFYTNVFDEKTDEEQAGLVSTKREQLLVMELLKEREYIIANKPELGFSL